MTTPALTIIEAMDHPDLFGQWFADTATWQPWRAFLRALYALPFAPGDLAIYQQCTGRDHPPESPILEAWLPVGRRGGKSRIAALVGCYTACFIDWRPHLAPGERGVVMILACDRRQARVILNYVKAFVLEIPTLAVLVLRETEEGLELATGIDIEVHTSNFRAVRGRTIVAALLDEIAFWRDHESANPDTEVLTAIRPGMASVPDALLLAISSPYSQRGVLWEAYRDHHGQDGDEILVWQADTRTMNASIPQSFIDKEYARDPARATAEYGALFRTDIEGFLDADLLATLVRAAPLELPPINKAGYFAFTDPSGGRGDAFTLAIAHHDGERVIVDLCRSIRPPFDPAIAVRQHAATLKEYGIRVVTGDHYSGAWVAEAFREEGITYNGSPLAKSAIYLEALPQFTRGLAELPDDARLLTELAQLERRTSRSGKDSVDHPPRGHDDLANAACGALWLAATRQGVALDEQIVAGWAAGNMELLKEPTMAFDPRFGQ